MTSNQKDSAAPKKPAETEVRARPIRRTYTDEYKRRIVDEVNAAPRGTMAEILRREGLYSATVDNWRRELAGSMASRKRGRKASPETPLKKELERLARENERLKRKLEHAELIISVQKKVARMFDQPSDPDDEH